MIEFKINILGGWLSASKIQEGLTDAFGQGTDDIELPGSGVRGVDPAILVALVSATGTAIGAFIGGLLSVAKQSAAKRIVVEKGDLKIDVPLKCSNEELEKIVKTLKSLDDESVNLNLET